MPEFNISEANMVQMPMARHAAKAGWTPVAPRRHRSGAAGCSGENWTTAAPFHPWTTGDAVDVIERLGSRPPTIEANRQMLNGCEESGDGEQSQKPGRRLK